MSLTKDEMIIEIKNLKKEIKRLKNEVEVTNELPGTAVDYIRIGRHIKQVVIKYNLDTGGAKVEGVNDFFDGARSQFEAIEFLNKTFLDITRGRKQ